MSDAVDKLIDAILVQEGGYSDDAHDAGGPTMWGITHWDLAAWRGVKDVSAQETRNLSQAEARLIYRKKYFEQPHIDLLPPAIQGEVMDLGVNAGPTVGIKEMQEVLNEAGFGVDTDGVIGPQTARQAWAAWRAMGGYLVNAIVERREQFYQGIVDRNGTQAKFLRGWMSRAETFRDHTADAQLVAEGQRDNPPPTVVTQVDPPLTSPKV